MDRSPATHLPLFARPKSGSITPAALAIGTVGKRVPAWLAGRDTERVKVFVTGGTGFVGSHIVSALVAASRHEPKTYSPILSKMFKSLDAAPARAEVASVRVAGSEDRTAIAVCAFTGDITAQPWAGRAPG